MQVIWNPQGYGSPDLPGNSAAAYYPGDAYVDVVGDDLYDIGGKAAWAAAAALYAAHPRKPFAIGEWGLWGVDDARFVGADGDVPAPAPAGGGRELLLGQVGVRVRPQLEAELAGGVQVADLAARRLAATVR